MRWLACLVVAPGLLGCGSDISGDPNTASVGGSSATGGQPAAGGAGGSGVGGTAGTIGGKGGGAGAAGTSAGSGGDSTGELPLIPLIVGRRSTFQFEALDPNVPIMDSCDEPAVEIGAMETIQGVSGIRYQSFCSATAVLITGSGDSLTAYPIDSNSGTTLGMAVEYIHSPVAEGESWQAGDSVMTWAAAPEPVTVAGGTFANCWERVAPIGVASFVYCRGIGLVSGTHTPGNWRLELVTKNF